MILSLTIALALQSAAPAHGPSNGDVPRSANNCIAIANTQSTLSDASIRYIVIGEMHGTTETPAIFGDLACLGADAGRKPVIALELPVNMQHLVSTYLRSDGSTASEGAMINHRFWMGQDGRSSVAMWDLLRRLRDMYAQGRIANVILFQPA